MSRQPVRGTHIDGDAVVRQQLGTQSATVSTNRRSPVFRDQPEDAAAGIAARLGLAAVGVEDAYEQLRRRSCGGWIRSPGRS
jgi:hypothetical protein